MPRPRLPKAQKLSEIVFIKLRPAERRALDRIHVLRARAKHPQRSRSAIMREAFQCWLEQEQRFDVATAQIAAVERKRA